MEEAMTVMKAVYEIIARMFLTVPYGLYGIQIVQRLGKKDMWLIGFFLGSLFANIVVSSLI